MWNLRRHYQKNVNNREWSWVLVWVHFHSQQLILHIQFQLHNNYYNSLTKPLLLLQVTSPKVLFGFIHSFNLFLLIFFISTCSEKELGFWCAKHSSSSKSNSLSTSYYFFDGFTEGRNFTSQHKFVPRYWTLYNWFFEGFRSSHYLLGAIWKSNWPCE